jgi:hypothetical protein
MLTRVANAIDRSFKLLRLYHLSDGVLSRDDSFSKKELAKSGCRWRTIQYNPETHKFNMDLLKINKALKPFPIDRESQYGPIYIMAIHLAANSEHIAPNPLLITFSVIGQDFIIQARDFGRGLGKYLNYIGSNFSTRPFELRMKFGLEDSGNGLLCIMNQALNGCHGRVTLESLGELVLLTKGIDDKIIGFRSFGSTLVGARITLFLPLTLAWQKTCSGWDPCDLPLALDINYLPGRPNDFFAHYFRF